MSPRGLVAAVAVLLAGVPLHVAPAGAQAGVDLTAEIDGHQLAETSDSSPLRLDPRRPADLSVRVVNGSDSPLDVRGIRLEGRVAGLTFFAYDTSVVLGVAPGASESRRYRLDLRGLEGQATGLMPAKVKLLDDDRRAVAAESLVVDVRGSMRSLYGFFGLTVLVLTALAFASAVIALARHRLPPNRWFRAMRFAPIGIGLGLVVVFTLSALRVVAPRAGPAMMVVAIATIVAAAMGYFTPTPDEEVFRPS